MALFGVCWIADIDSIQDFTSASRNLLKPLSRRIHGDNEISPEMKDQTFAEVWDSINDK